MAHSTAAALPSKPRPDFPLYPHQSDRWAKKVRGQTRFFGKASTDPKGEAALAEWLRQKDYLLACRTPPPKDADAPILADLVNKFLTWKRGLVESGELAPRTWDRYDATCGMLVEHFGRRRRIDDLTSDDFEQLRAKMAKRWGPVALGNEVQIVRSIFRYGHEAGLLDKPVRFGPAFKRPTQKTLRLQRANSGPKTFSAEQIQQLLRVASPNMAAMTLLGINGGLGNVDLAYLPMNAIDLKTGWLDYPRVKTGVPRRIPLWKETVAAIHKVIATRPEPRDKQYAALLFISHDGRSYVESKPTANLVSAQFRYVLNAANVTGRSFYDLRRTFCTIADNLSRDKDSVRFIMGHADDSEDMTAKYRQGFIDDRLLNVVQRVRRWLMAEPAKRAKGKGVQNAE